MGFTGVNGTKLPQKQSLPNLLYLLTYLLTYLFDYGYY